MADSDDDLPVLSDYAAAALKEFLAEREATVEKETEIAGDAEKFAKSGFYNLISYDSYESYESVVPPKSDRHES